ncbi:MAG: outer membrane protein assembly factor BamD [Rhodothalassiaceae bacterium]
MTFGWSKAIAAGIAAMALAACSPDEQEVYVSADVATLYNAAGDFLDRKQWDRAAGVFNEVERQHPYSEWARRAQLMSAYAHYESRDYDQAILAAERFLTLHPGSQGAPYAYYLIGLSYYAQILDVGRDQRITRQAHDALLEVMRRFPDTDYARDAKAKFELTRDQLAGKEMEIGRFYQRREQYLAAISRFRSVVEVYDTTTHVPEALHRLVETYMALGIVPEAQTYAAVLGHNYPNSKWYRYSYQLLTGESVAPPEEADGGFLFGLF